MLRVQRKLIHHILPGQRLLRAPAQIRLPLATGAPALVSAVVALDCRIVEVKAVATHNLFIAAVEAIRHGPEGPALVYHDRAYKRV